MGNGRTELCFDVVADDGKALVCEALGEFWIASDEDGNTVDEGQASFEGAPTGGLTTIDGGLGDGDRPGGKRPKLRVVKTDEE